MRCKLNEEIITNYIEGNLSEQQKEKVSAHIRACDKCSALYDAIIFGKKYAKGDLDLPCDFTAKVMGSIDRSRYKSKSVFYLIGSSLLRLKPVIVSITAAAAVLVIAFLGGRYGPQYFDRFSGSITYNSPSSTSTDGNKSASTPDEITETPQIAPTTITRPDTKVETIKIEGMDEQQNFNIVISSALGMSTYITEGFVSESESSEEGDWLNIYTNYQGVRNEKAAVKIFSPAKGKRVTIDEMLLNTKQEMEKEGFDVIDMADSGLMDSFRNFSGKMFNINNEADGEPRNAIVGTVLIFNHGDRVYRIVFHYPIEYGDGFYPRVYKIFDDFMWDDGSMLFD